MKKQSGKEEGVAYTDTLCTLRVKSTRSLEQSVLGRSGIDIRYCHAT